MKSGKVYLFQNGSLFKIGFSTDIETRLLHLKANAEPDARIIHAINTNDCRGLEAHWHAFFDARRIRGEWFELSCADVTIFCSYLEMEPPAEKLIVQKRAVRLPETVGRPFKEGVRLDIHIAPDVAAMLEELAGNKRGGKTQVVESAVRAFGREIIREASGAVSKTLIVEESVRRYAVSQRTVCA